MMIINKCKKCGEMFKTYYVPSAGYQTEYCRKCYLKIYNVDIETTPFGNDIKIKEVVKK